MKWIKIIKKGTTKSGKTEIYHVYTKDKSTFLGWIVWYAAWRKYCFGAEKETLFEQDCLRDIAKFTESMTKRHYEEKAKLKRNKTLDDLAAEGQKLNMGY